MPLPGEPLLMSSVKHVGWAKVEEALLGSAEAIRLACELMARLPPRALCGTKYEV